MDIVRYVLAVGLLMVMLPVYLYWFSIHPFISFWRRVGPRRTLIIHASCMVLVAILICLVRKPLLLADYGTNWKLMLLAVFPMALSVYLRVRISKKFRGSTLKGLPELANENHEGALLTTGIYSRIAIPDTCRCSAHCWPSRWSATTLGCTCLRCWGSLGLFQSHGSKRRSLRTGLDRDTSSIENEFRCSSHVDSLFTPRAILMR